MDCRECKRECFISLREMFTEQRDVDSFVQLHVVKNRMV